MSRRQPLEERPIVDLGWEGQTVYYTDGTHYGPAVQVWKKEPMRRREPYCLLSGWPGSSAARRMGNPKREVREVVASSEVLVGQLV